MHKLENSSNIKIPKKYLDRIWAIDIIKADDSPDNKFTYMLVFQDDWCWYGFRSVSCFSQKEVLDAIRNSKPWD